MKDFRYMSIVAAAALGLAVAGCSGGGDDGLSTSQEQQLQDDKKAAEAQVATLQTQINALRAQLELDPADNLGDSIEGLQTELTRLQKMVDDAADAVADAAAKAKKAMAAKLFAGLDTTSTDLDAATIGITSTGLSADADGTTDTVAAVTLKATETKVESLGQGVWNGTDYIRKTATVTDHAVIYNNQDTPKMVLFAVKYATQLAEDSDAGRLNNTYLTADVTGRKSLIASDDFASGSGFIDHTDEANDVVKIRGSFNGGMGYYHCSQAGGTPCRSEVDGSGGITLDGGWSFEPDTGTMAVTPDAAYVLFGWWSREVATGVDVATFAQHDTAPVGVENTALTGTATYMGGAAGKYSINEPVEGDPNSGAFTAHAELTAKFGNGTDEGTISGMLSGFMTDHGEKDWTVALTGAGTDAEAAITNADGFGGATASGTVWTIDETAGAKSGSWSGNFYYESAAQQEAANTPPVAAGTFSASYGNVGRMVGAFGAEKQ